MGISDGIHRARVVERPQPNPLEELYKTPEFQREYALELARDVVAQPEACFQGGYRYLAAHVIRREGGVEIGPVTIGPGPWYCHEVPLCPSCRSGKPEEGHNYCPNCGTRLKWRAA